MKSLSAFFVYSALGFAASAFLGCVSKTNTTSEEKPVAVVESVAHRAARETEAPYFVDIEFSKGSSELDEQANATISALLNRARAAGPLQDVKVLSWADDEYPSASRKKLSSAERRLANSRTRAIEKHIKSLQSDVKVDGHNMAERPNAFSRWFNTTDARFKRSLVAAGLPTTADEAMVTGRASHAVVLVTLKP